MSLIGWFGYIDVVSQVIPVLDELVRDGYNFYRQRIRPGQFNPAITDLLVQEAKNRGISICLDAYTNFPPSNFPLDSNIEAWLAQVIMIGQRYNSETHVTIEPLNESLREDLWTLFDMAAQRIREAGVTLPMLFNSENWNVQPRQVNDPLQNYAIGAHHYGDLQDSYNPQGLTYEEVLNDGNNIRYYLDRYIHTLNHNKSVAWAEALNIPNGFMVTELGPTANVNLLDTPTTANMAYAMAFQRELFALNVPCALMMFGQLGGTANKKAIYEPLAQQMFSMPYAETPVQPPPPDCVLNEDCQTKYGDPAPGYMWICEGGVCVQRKVVSPSLAARTVGPFGVPASMLHQLWKLRQKYIRPEVHKKLHPVV